LVSIIYFKFWKQKVVGCLAFVFLRTAFDVVSKVGEVGVINVVGVTGLVGIVDVGDLVIVIVDVGDLVIVIVKSS
jgi:hypothetical protein